MNSFSGLRPERNIKASVLISCISQAITSHTITHVLNLIVSLAKVPLLERHPAMIWNSPEIRIHSFPWGFVPGWLINPTLKNIWLISHFNCLASASSHWLLLYILLLVKELYSSSYFQDSYLSVFCLINPQKLQARCLQKNGFSRH